MANIFAPPGAPRTKYDYGPPPRTKYDYTVHDFITNLLAAVGKRVGLALHRLHPAVYM